MSEVNGAAAGKLLTEAEIDRAEIEGRNPFEEKPDTPNVSAYPVQFVGVGIEPAEGDNVNVTVSMVATTKGLLPRAELLTKTVVYEQLNSHVIAVEWYHGFHPEAEMVRRDVHVTMLTGNPIGTGQGKVGG